jgi:aspartate kinase
MSGRQRSSRFESGDEVVVMKFGGTSVEDADAIGRLISIVGGRPAVRPVIVVSALAGVTDQLVDAGNSAANGHLGSALATVRNIYVRHENVAGDLVYGEPYAAFNRELRTEFQALESLLIDLDACRQLTPQYRDHLLGFGERVSSHLVWAALREAGFPAAHVDACTCIITDARYGQAIPLWDATNRRIQDAIGPLLESGLVPVIGGFIASTIDGIPTTLGRGGSDFTAAIVGAALYASRVEIWTDVDGIMTTDPKLCAEAQVIPRMSFDEAAELARCGAKVLHPATMVPAMRENIPVHVLNSRNPGGNGTRILAGAQNGNSVTAITARRNMAMVEIESERGLDSEVLRAASYAFDQRSCEIDLMTVSRAGMSVLVSSPDALPGVAAELLGIAEVKWENHQALVSLVGENIRRQPEIASRVFAAVAYMDVRVVCPDDSDRTISFLVEDAKVEDAVQKLHRVFFPQAETSLNWGSVSGALGLGKSGSGPSASELGRL